MGQWASGKTEAARILIRHLGGEGEVVFITDRVLFASQAIDHIFGLEDSKVVTSIEDDGRRRLDGELVTVWLSPGEDLRTVDPGSLDFDVYDDQTMNVWRNKAKVKLGFQIRQRSAYGKPMVIEAAFGPNMEPVGENPYGRTISDLFMRLEETGVAPSQVKWIIIEAGFDKRAERNEKRLDSIPAHYFDKFATDGGDLTQDHQNILEGQGVLIKRISNEHDDIEQFRADLIAAFEEIFRGE